MLKEIKNSKNNDLLNDFSCFNTALYDNFYFNDYDEDEEEYNNNKLNNDNNISDDESSINTSCQSIEYKEEEENRFIPSDLLEEEINCKNKNDNFNFIHKLNINCEPYIPTKAKLSQNLVSNNLKNKNDINNKCNNCIYNLYWPFLGYSEQNNNNYINKSNINKKKEKKKKNFIQKEGDWVCYDCKNINFSFRNKCNRCKLLKEDSEAKFLEAEKRILKLYNINDVKER